MTHKNSFSTWLKLLDFKIRMLLNGLYFIYDINNLIYAFCFVKKLQVYFIITLSLGSIEEDRVISETVL